MMKKVLIVVALSVLVILFSAATVWATPAPLPEPSPPSPPSGPPGTAVTWTFETPLVNGAAGFIPGENGNVLFGPQEIDVGDFVVPILNQLGTTVIFNVPAEAPVGTNTVRARGTQSGYEVTDFFEVTATQVPYTGGTPITTLPSWLAYLAGALMLAAGGAIVWRRTKTA